jgi:hypothetical protein
VGHGLDLYWAGLVASVQNPFPFFFFFFLLFFSAYSFSLYLLHFDSKSLQTKKEIFLKFKRTIQNSEHYDFIIKQCF